LFLASAARKVSGLKGCQVTPAGLAIMVRIAGPGASQTLISGVLHGQA
jgi:hypothetical protein